MTEYRCNLEDGKLVASRIFEVGMKKFGTDVAFVLAHISFLLTVNDKNSTYLFPEFSSLFLCIVPTVLTLPFFFSDAHALFERVIGTFTPQEARPIWECWSRSQYQYDDLEAVLDLERRMMEIYPNGACFVGSFYIVFVSKTFLNSTSSLIQPSRPFRPSLCTPSYSFLSVSTLPIISYTVSLLTCFPPSSLIYIPFLLVNRLTSLLN
jgi:hypothetical protein